MLILMLEGQAGEVGGDFCHISTIASLNLLSLERILNPPTPCVYVCICVCVNVCKTGSHHVTLAERELLT